MTAQGWLQIALYLGVLTALAPLLGGYMARVYQDERVFLTPVLGPLERLTYRLLRVDPNRAAGLEGLRAHRDRLQPAVLARALPDPAHAGHPPVQPRRASTPAPWDVTLQHDVVVRHQHELAVLRRRDDAVLLLADGRPDGAELRLGRGRHGGAGRGDPRLRARAAASALGNFWQDLTADAALHPAAAVASSARWSSSPRA